MDRTRDRIYIEHSVLNSRHHKLCSNGDSKSPLWRFFGPQTLWLSLGFAWRDRKNRSNSPTWPTRRRRPVTWAISTQVALFVSVWRVILCIETGQTVISINQTSSHPVSPCALHHLCNYSPDLNCARNTTISEQRDLFTLWSPTTWPGGSPIIRILFQFRRVWYFYGPRSREILHLLFAKSHYDAPGGVGGRARLSCDLWRVVPVSVVVDLLMGIAGEAEEFCHKRTEFIYLFTFQSYSNSSSATMDLPPPLIWPDFWLTDLSQ